MKDLYSVTDEEWAAMSWLERASVMVATADRAREMGLAESSIALSCQAAQFIGLHKASSEPRER